MVQRFKQLIQDSKAVSALEYAILIGIISVAIAAVLVNLGGEITSAIDKAGKKVKVSAQKAGVN